MISRYDTKLVSDPGVAGGANRHMPHTYVHMYLYLIGSSVLPVSVRGEFFFLLFFRLVRRKEEPPVWDCQVPAYPTGTDCAS